MNKLIYTILLFTIYHFSFGQGTFPSSNGLFTANYLKGCAGTTITVTPTTTGTYFFCFTGDPTDVASQANLDCFNEQANQTDNLSFTYNSPGTYTILALKQLTNSQQFDSLKIEIIAPQLPAFSTVNCNGIINFDLNKQAESFDFYTVDFGDGSAISEYAISQFPVNHSYADNSANYTVNVSARLDNAGFNNCGNNLFTFTITPAQLQEIPATIDAIRPDSDNAFSIDYSLNANQNYTLQLKQSSNGPYDNILFISGTSSGSFTFTGLDLINDFYCARIIASSQCNSTSLISNEVCTLIFEAEATQNGNLLNWNSAQFQTTTVYKNGNPVFTGDAPFLDSNVLCGQSDSYYLEATDQNGIIQTSPTKEITAIFGNPSSGIEQISLNTLSNNELLINWEVPQGLQPENYNVYRKRGLSNNFILIGSSNTPEYTDIDADFDSKYFTYGISYTNSCGGESSVQTRATNIVLSLEVKDNNIQLNWNNYTGYPTLFDGFILRQYDASMNLINSYNLADTSLTINTALSEIQKFNFQVEAHSSSGATSFSNTIGYKIPSTFFVPTAFSPDGNGLNEELKVLGKFIDQVEFSIYNKWGNLIFKTSDIAIGWDGYLQNREAPEGTYSYIVTITDQFNETYVKSGVFNLIR